jgi:hypothetical protein
MQNMTKLARKASCHLIILSFLKDDPTLATIIVAPQLKILKNRKVKRRLKFKFK